MALKGSIGEGGGSAPSGKAKAPADSGWKFGSIPGEVGGWLGFPIKHPIKFAKGIGSEVAKIQHAPSALTAIGEQGLAKLTGRYGRMSEAEGERFAAKNVERIRGGIPFFGSMQASYAQAASPGELGQQGRAYLKAHPAQIGADILTVVAPLAKGTAAERVLSPVATARRAATGALVERFPGVAESLSEAARPVLSRLPSKKASGTYHELATAERQAEREVLHAEGPYAKELSALSQDERGALRDSLASGRRPAEPKLATAYDAYTTRKAALTADAEMRHLPTEAHAVLKDEVAAKMFKPLERVHGPDVARSMIDALRAGASNPHPQFGKSWRALQRKWGDAVRREDAKFKLVRDPELGEVYTPRTAQRLASARRGVETGKVTQEAYQALVDKSIPARFRPGMEPVMRMQEALRERARLEPGFGKGAYRKAMAEFTDDLGYATWQDLRDKGINPTHVHRSALLPGEEFRPSGARVTGRQPGALRDMGKLAEQYFDDPVVMLGEEELTLAKQDMFAKTIGRIHEKFGGSTWDDALQRAKSQGLGDERAARSVRSRMRHVDMAGNVSAARPGQTLVPVEVAKAVAQYLKKFDEPGMFDKFMSFWTVPILWLSPSFHINNIISGALLTSLEAGPTALIRHFREALRMAREGTMDVRVPTGAVSVPAYRRVFNAAEAEANGRGLARLLKTTGHNVVDTSRKFNEIADSMYRGITYLEQMRKSTRRGLTKEAAEETAVRAASNVMQNWDALSTIERQVFQRVMPFWGWKRAMLRYFLTYPVDHPYRTAFLRFVAAPYLDQQEASGLPDEFQNLIPISAEKGGKQWFFRARGLDPFADFGDLFSVRGFIGSLNPVVSTPLQYVGVDTYLGGVPAGYGDVTVDPQTGRLRKSYDPKVFGDLIPQLSAIMSASGLVKDLPAPPTDTSTNGWLRWLQHYGPKLRLPSVTERDVENAKAQMLRSQAVVQSRRLKAGQTGSSGGGLKGSIGGAG